MTEMKRKPAITAEINGTVLTLDFANGRSIMIDASILDRTIREAAIMHGLKQKLVDAAAISRDPDTGRSATIDDKYRAVLEIADRIRGENPTWNKVRGEGGSTSGSNLLIRALMRMTRKDRAAIDKFLEPKSKEEKAALRKNPKVAAVILEIQAEEAARNVDTDGMLEDLLGDDGPDLDGGDEGDDDEAPF